MPIGEWPRRRHACGVRLGSGGAGTRLCGSFVERVEQRLQLRVIALDRSVLDQAITTDLAGGARDIDAVCNRRVVEPTAAATDQPAVLADQSPFEAAFREIAERLDGRAATPLEPDEHADSRPTPHAQT